MARVGCRCGNGCPREASASGPGMGKRKDNVTEIHGCLRGVRRSAKSFRCIISFSPNCTVRSGCYYYSHDTYQKKKNKKPSSTDKKVASGLEPSWLPCMVDHVAPTTPYSVCLQLLSFSKPVYLLEHSHTLGMKGTGF